MLTLQLGDSCLLTSRGDYGFGWSGDAILATVFWRGQASQLNVSSTSPILEDNLIV